MVHEQRGVAVIGGSGLYRFDALMDVRLRSPETPFGSPSAPILEGRLGGVRMLFLARHGEGHVFSPSDVPYRANIFALKMLGAAVAVGVSAVGSLREEIRAGDLAVPHQLLDRTKGIRPASFFGRGCVAHVQFADPYCESLRRTLLDQGPGLGISLHSSATYVCMEGPQFSTRAEASFHRLAGGDVIGMTCVPEAKLAREAGICYANLALVTDDDCWRASDENVSVEMVMEALEKASGRARSVIARAAPRLAAARGCDCGRSLEKAIMTDPERIDADLRRDLGPLLDGIDWK